MRSEPYLHCLYAEDVRRELKGQISIIGVFQGGLRVSKFPTVIPKLFAIADLVIPKGVEIASLQIELKWGDKILQTISPPSDVLERAREAALRESRAGGYGVQFVLGVIPFEVDSSSTLSVTAKLNDTVVDGNALWVSVRPQKDGEKRPVPEDSTSQ